MNKTPAVAAYAGGSPDDAGSVKAKTGFPPLCSPGNPARRVMRKLTFQFFRYIHSRPGSYRIHVADRAFVVTSGVFTPKYRNLISLKASELLALNLQVPKGARVLDMGTGTGIQGIFAADVAKWVVATDVNPLASACAQSNAIANGIRNFEVRTGDLFEPVSGEQFDFIIWLPPSFFVDPETMTDRTFMCGSKGELIQRFWEGARLHLRPGGKVQFSCVDRTHRFMLHHLARNGFRCESILSVPRFPMETVRQYLAWQS